MDLYDNLPIYLGTMQSLKEDTPPEEENLHGDDLHLREYTEVPDAHRADRSSDFAVLGRFLLLIFILAVFAAIAILAMIL